MEYNQAMMDRTWNQDEASGGDGDTRSIEAEDTGTTSGNSWM